MAIRSALCKGRAHGRARQVTRRLLRSSARPSARCRRGPAAGAAPLPPAPARRRLLVFPSQWAEPLALEQAPQLPAPPRLVVGGSGAGSTREEGRGRCTAGRERYMLLLAGATLQTGHRSGASPEPPSAWSCSSSPIPLGFKPSCIYIDIYIFFPSFLLLLSFSPVQSGAGTAPRQPARSCNTAPICPCYIIPN